MLSLLHSVRDSTGRKWFGLSNLPSPNPLIAATNTSDRTVLFHGHFYITSATELLGRTE